MTNKLTFEESLAGLEKIVEELESGDIPLAELVKKYEDGTEFLKVCESQLKEAELKIKKLSTSKKDQLEFEDFEEE